MKLTEALLRFFVAPDETAQPPVEPVPTVPPAKEDVRRRVAAYAQVTTADAQSVRSAVFGEGVVPEVSALADVDAADQAAPSVATSDIVETALQEMSVSPASGVDGTVAETPAVSSADATTAETPAAKTEPAPVATWFGPRAFGNENHGELDAAADAPEAASELDPASDNDDRQAETAPVADDSSDDPASHLDWRQLLKTATPPASLDEVPDDTSPSSDHDPAGDEISQTPEPRQEVAASADASDLLLANTELERTAPSTVEPRRAPSRELVGLEATAELAEAVGLGFHLGLAVERIAAAAGNGSEGVTQLKEAAWLIERYVAILERRPIGADIHASAARLAQVGDAIAGLKAIAATFDADSNDEPRANTVGNTDDETGLPAGHDLAG